MTHPNISFESGTLFEENLASLSEEEAAMIVRASLSMGVLTSAHLTSVDDLASVLSAGIQNIAHMLADTRIPDRLIQKMVKKEIYCTPTLTSFKKMGDGLVETAKRNLRRFIKAKGKVALGTDFPGFCTKPNAGMPMTEILLMKEAGMKPMDIIIASTRNSAQVCNLGRVLGTLERGKTADLFEVEGNPIKNLNALTKVKIVIRVGVIIKND